MKLANSKTISMEVNKDMVVSVMMKNMMTKISITGNQWDGLYISVGTKIISEESADMKVSDLNIRKDSTIFVLPRLRGGKIKTLV